MNGLYVVAGASGAIGRALCSRIVRNGGTPIYVGRNHDKLQQAAEEVLSLTKMTSLDDPVIISGIDFVDPSEAGKKLASELKVVAPSSISGLAYAVGSITLKPLRGCKASDFLDSYNLNVLGAVECIKAALPQLKKGSTIEVPSGVVLFSSVAASRGLPNHAVVGTSKAAIEGLTKALSAELAPSNVRVNCVAPSLTKKSEMGLSMTTNENMASALAAAHPIPRLGEPDDAAAAAAYLLSSSESGWTTGVVLPVDGGRSSILK